MRIGEHNPANNHRNFAYSALAWLLATCKKSEFRDGQKAVELARKACELSNWNDYHILDTLAAACAEAGKFDEAAKWAKKALADPKATTAERKFTQRRLELYEERKPYHQD